MSPPTPPTGEPPNESGRAKARASRYWTEDQLAQLHADKELHAFLRSCSPDSEVIRDFEQELSDKAIGTILWLFGKRLLFKRLRRLGYRFPDWATVSPVLSREIPRLSWIAAHTAIPPFMAAYIFGDEWDPTGASLRGCFINASLLSFGREYHQFLQQESPPREFLTLTGEIEDDDYNPLTRLYATAADEEALRAGEIEQMLGAELSPEDKLMFIRAAQGFKQKTIAEELGISEAAVSTRMRRNRKKFTNTRGEDGERDV